MRNLCRALSVWLYLVASAPALAQTPEAPAEPGAGEQPTVSGEQPAAPAEPGKRCPKALCYLPNRLFDVLDLVRARVRLGSGAAVGLRVTVAEVFLGEYQSVYVGLPGPRRARKRPWLAGPEEYMGARLLFLGRMSESSNDPDYSPTEIGASAHALIVGADVGVDVWEVVDLLGGFILLDPRKDDL